MVERHTHEIRAKVGDITWEVYSTITGVVISETVDLAEAIAIRDALRRGALLSELETKALNAVRASNPGSLLQPAIHIANGPFRIRQRVDKRWAVYSSVNEVVHCITETRDEANQVCNQLNSLQPEATSGVNPIPVVPKRARIMPPEYGQW